MVRRRLVAPRTSFQGCNMGRAMSSCEVYLSVQAGALVVGRPGGVRKSKCCRQRGQGTRTLSRVVGSGSDVRGRVVPPRGVDRGCKCGDSMTAGARPSASEVLSAIYGELTIPMVHINGKASGPLLASGFRPLAE